MSFTFKGPQVTIKDKYDTFSINRKGHIIHLELCRPEEFNSTDLQYYDDFVHFFNAVNFERDVRCILITAQGKHFCSGLDLKEAAPTIFSFDESLDTARKALQLEHTIIHMQNAYTAIEKCRWPVIAAVHGACIGAGVDMITACDIVYCTKSSFFSIKEVDIGITADIGTLQRLPIIAANWSLMKEYALTGEKITSDQAASLGMVSRVFEDEAELRSRSMITARASLESRRDDRHEIAHRNRRHQVHSEHSEEQVGRPRTRRGEKNKHVAAVYARPH